MIILLVLVSPRFWQTFKSKWKSCWQNFLLCEAIYNIAFAMFYLWCRASGEGDMKFRKLDQIIWFPRHVFSEIVGVIILMTVKYWRMQIQGHLGRK